MKILVITPSLDAYSETFIRQHVQLLPGEVSVLHEIDTPRLNDEPFQPENRWSQTFKRLFFPAKEVWEAFKSRTISRLIAKAAPDVILIEYGPVGAAFVNELEACGVPFVVHFHGYDASVDEVFETWGAGYRRMFASAAGLVAVSQAMKRRLIAFGAPEEKITHISYGIDPSRFCQVSPAAQPPNFLAVGRFVEKKAPFLTLLAFERVWNACPDARLTMIGDGPLLELCRRIARGLKLDRAVNFRTSVPHEEVFRAMQTSRAFIQHSVAAPNGDCEGTPVAISEAMMAGLPVVATRHAGIPDIMEHEKTGFLVDEFDVPQMAQWMAKLARDPQLAGEVGARARAFALEHLTTDACIGKLAALLEKAAKTRKNEAKNGRGNVNERSS